MKTFFMFFILATIFQQAQSQSLRDSLFKKHNVSLGKSTQSHCYNGGFLVQLKRLMEKLGIIQFIVVIITHKKVINFTREFMLCSKVYLVVWSLGDCTRNLKQEVYISKD